MTLVDTSVWIDFFTGRAHADALADLLEANDVLLHPWVLGELVLGNLGSGSEAIAADLKRLPTAPRVRDDEVLDLVFGRRLAGRGVGWVDVHLLASALVAPCDLWTFDRSLGSAAADLGLVSYG